MEGLFRIKQIYFFGIGMIIWILHGLIYRWLSEIRMITPLWSIDFYYQHGWSILRVIWPKVFFLPNEGSSISGTCKILASQSEKY